MAAGLVMDACTKTHNPLRDLIGVRYTRLENLPVNPEYSGDEETTRGIRQRTGSTGATSRTDSCLST